MIRLILACVIFIEPAAGVYQLTWTNDIQAESIAVFNVTNTACPYPVVVAVDPNLTGQTTTIPEGPPYDQRCLLKPGDTFYLIRYKHGYYVDQIGPFAVPRKFYLPLIGAAP